MYNFTVMHLLYASIHRCKWPGSKPLSGKVRVRVGVVVRVRARYMHMNSICGERSGVDVTGLEQRRGGCIKACNVHTYIQAAGITAESHRFGPQQPNRSLQACQGGLRAPTLARPQPLLTPTTMSICVCADPELSANPKLSPESPLPHPLTLLRPCSGGPLCVATVLCSEVQSLVIIGLG